MFCPNCGAQQVNENAVFCNNCGTPLRQFTTQSDSQAQAAPAPAYPAQQPGQAQQSAPAPAPANYPQTYGAPGPQAAGQPPAQSPYAPAASANPAGQPPMQQPYAPAASAIPAGQPPYGAPPAAPAPQPAQGKPGPNKKLIIIIAAAAVVAIGAIIAAVIIFGQGASGAAGSSTASSLSSAQAPAGMQAIGSSSVGQLYVPTSWTDRSEDLDKRTIDDYGMVYYASPGSEYTSKAMSTTAFAESIQLSIWNTDYESVAKTVSDDFTSDPTMYSDVEVGTMTFNGHNAAMVSAYVPQDKQQVLAIAIDRDGDGKATVLIKANSGTNEKQAEDVLSYISSWKF